MISPVRIDESMAGNGAGRPPRERTYEILGEIEVAMALGRYTVRMPLGDDEEGAHHRFAQKARCAARMAGCGVRVRCRDGVAEMTLLYDGR